MIDLRTDAISQSPREMIEAMSQAETGDDVFDDDPTGNKLQGMMAEKFGKEASLFMPTTSMGNLASVMHWTKPGD